MAKSIGEKLDFLMKLTDTTNKVLAEVLGFDMSYISRIRGGTRGLPLHQPFVEPAAAYFASHLTEEYQQRAVAEELLVSRGWPEDEEEAKALLMAWLKNERAKPRPMEQILAVMTGPVAPPPLSETDYPTAEGKKVETKLYYGNSGKRDSVIAFLSDLCDTGEPHTLLLHSDEGMEWLYEDKAFARYWAGLLGKLVEHGSKIKIIHTISRDANEMWEAVQNWLPLYMSGAIEPYYYPRLRDGVYHRTLFVAEGRSALIANSVQGQQGEPLNLLIRDKTAVAALEKEFAAYFALCRPLMEFSRPESIAELGSLMRDFMDAPGKPMAAFSGSALVCLKEDAGALVIKTDAPFAVFSIKEPRMVTAMEDYLRNLPNGGNGEQAIQQLEEYDHHGN